MYNSARPRQFPDHPHVDQHTDACLAHRLVRGKRRRLKAWTSSNRGAQQPPQPGGRGGRPQSLTHILETTTKPTPLKAIRSHRLWCANGSGNEVSESEFTESEIKLALRFQLSLPCRESLDLRCRHDDFDAVRLSVYHFFRDEDGGRSKAEERAHFGAHRALSCSSDDLRNLAELLAVGTVQRETHEPGV